MTRTATPIDTFVGALHDLVRDIPDEHELTASVAREMRILLASGFELPAEVTTPDPDRYVMYPLLVADDGSFSIASAVWNVGQKTPVHGHETWGVVGIYSGVEHEVRYVKPAAPGVALQSKGEHDWTVGEVTVCCTTDDDVHMVSCGSDVACVGIHVYGANIGTLSRRSYDSATGAANWFVSTWATPGSYRQ